MDHKEEAAALLRLGLTPIEIASFQGSDLQTVLGHLDSMIGHGVIRRSDVFFSVVKASRQAIRANEVASDSVRDSPARVAETLSGDGVPVLPEDVEIVRRYGAARDALGDVYEDIRAIEVGLHDLIRSALQQAHGDEDDAWFRCGIPRIVREKCGGRWAAEDGPDVPHPFCFADLIDFRTIMEKEWSIVSPHLPPDLRNDRRSLLSDLLRLNGIRRLVMHPIRGAVPSEDDFDFLWNLRHRFGFADQRAVIKVRKGSSQVLSERLQELPPDQLDKVRTRLAERF